MSGGISRLDSLITDLQNNHNLLQQGLNSTPTTGQVSQSLAKIQKVTKKVEQQTTAYVNTLYSMADYWVALNDFPSLLDIKNVKQKTTELKDEIQNIESQRDKVVMEMQLLRREFEAKEKILDQTITALRQKSNDLLDLKNRVTKASSDLNELQDIYNAIDDSEIEEKIRLQLEMDIENENVHQLTEFLNEEQETVALFQKEAQHLLEDRNTLYKKRALIEKEIALYGSQIDARKLLKTGVEAKEIVAEDLSVLNALIHPS